MFKLMIIVIDAILQSKNHYNGQLLSSDNFAVHQKDKICKQETVFRVNSSVVIMRFSCEDNIFAMYWYLQMKVEKEQQLQENQLNRKRNFKGWAPEASILLLQRIISSLCNSINRVIFQNYQKKKSLNLNLYNVLQLLNLGNLNDHMILNKEIGLTHTYYDRCYCTGIQSSHYNRV